MNDHSHILNDWQLFQEGNKHAVYKYTGKNDKFAHKILRLKKIHHDRNEQEYYNSINQIISQYLHPKYALPFETLEFGTLLPN
jgi:hypothetical protein